VAFSHFTDRLIRNKKVTSFTPDGQEQNSVALALVGEEIALRQDLGAVLCLSVPWATSGPRHAAAQGLDGCTIESLATRYRRRENARHLLVRRLSSTCAGVDEATLTLPRAWLGATLPSSAATPAEGVLEQV